MSEPVDQVQAGVGVGVGGVMEKLNVHWKSNIPWPSEARVIAPAEICIVLEPCTTGDGLKWKVIVALPFDKINEFAKVPFTVKSVAWTLDGFAGSLRLIMKSVGPVPVTRLPQAGVVVVTEKPTNSLSVKASCWDVLLMVRRPSSHDERCLVRIAEP